MKQEKLISKVDSCGCVGFGWSFLGKLGIIVWSWNVMFGFGVWQWYVWAMIYLTVW